MSISEPLAIVPNVYYTVEEVAHLLRVSNQAALSLLESGKMQGIRIDGEWRVLGAKLLNLSAEVREPEATLVSDWFHVSARSLKEIWDNEEDSVYDQ